MLARGCWPGVCLCCPGLSLNLMLTVFKRLAGQRAPGVRLSAPPQLWGYSCMSLPCRFEMWVPRWECGAWHLSVKCSAQVPTSPALCPSAARLPSPPPFLSPVASVGHVARQQEKQLRWLFNAKTPKTMKTDFWQETPPHLSSTLLVFLS